MKKGGPGFFPARFRKAMSSDNRGAGPNRYRRSGDDNILIEYGPIALDLRLRLKAHLMMEGRSAQSWSQGFMIHRPASAHCRCIMTMMSFSETRLLDA